MSEYDREASITGRPWPQKRLSPHGGKKNYFQESNFNFFHMETKIKKSVRGKTSDRPFMICDGQSVGGTGVSAGHFSSTVSVWFRQCFIGVLIRSCMESAI